MMSSPTAPSATLLPVGVDDRERPALERQADADGPVAVEQRCAGDHRRFGRAVGVPQLAAVGDEPRDELGRAGLAAEDQQPDVLDRVLRPERRERRHRGDDRDAVADEPRPQVFAGAHERARRGDQARTVPPREPHLLARRIERDREAGQHPVARRQRGGSQEQSRFGIDERRCRAVRDGDALGHAGGARGEDDPRIVVDGRRGQRRDDARTRVRGIADEQIVGRRQRSGRVGAAETPRRP